ncbi:MAG: hypothetical protein WC730_02930 [Patescibacteria group bacterium]|jgi:hypothetical protein
MTAPENLVRIAEYGGILIDPSNLENADPDFTCSKLFTHPLVEQKRMYNFTQSGRDESERSSKFDYPYRYERHNKETQSLTLMDTEEMYGLLKENFPEAYTKIISLYKELASKYGNYYRFDGDQFTVRAVREFVVDGDQKNIQNEVSNSRKRIISIIADIIDDLRSKFDDSYGDRTEETIMELILNPLKNSPIDPPFFYSRGGTAQFAVLIIKLDNDFLGEEEHGRGYSYEDPLGSRVVSNSKYTDDKGRPILPIWNIEGIVVLDTDSIKPVLKAVTRAHRKNPNFSIPIYDKEGNLIFQT